MPPELDTPSAIPDAAPAAPPEPAIRSRAEIARELFGKDFHGEVAPASKPEEAEEPKPVDTEGGEVPPEQPEGEQPEEGVSETAPEEDTGETPIETVSELVEHLGTSQDWLNTLKVPVTVDGTPTDATIGDLIKSYQIATAAEHRLEDAKAVAKKESEVWAAKHSQIDT